MISEHSYAKPDLSPSQENPAEDSRKSLFKVEMGLSAMFLFLKSCTSGSTSDLSSSSEIPQLLTGFGAHQESRYPAVPQLSWSSLLLFY